VRIGVFADVHADLDALRAVLDDITARRVDEAWCLGDIVGAGPRPSACAELVRERCALALAGNHDVWAVRDGIAGAGWNPHTGSSDGESRVLDTKVRLWLASLHPHASRHGVRCYHGGPRNPVMQWINTPADAAPLLLEPGEITLVAHTHQPAAFMPGPGGDLVGVRPRAGETVALGAACVLNPGAVARPQLDEDPSAYWMLLDLSERRATWLTVSGPEPHADRRP
jgi:predicted phosphodiesterase